MNNELDALLHKGTWSLVALPPNVSIVGCRRGYKIKHVTIHIVLSLVVSMQWTIKQIDIHNAFLYIYQPQGVVHPQYPSHLCRLYKSFYSLKQGL